MIINTAVLKQVASAMQKKGSYRPVLSGVNIKRTDDGIIWLAATDGTVLSAIPCPELACPWVDEVAKSQASTCNEITIHLSTVEMIIKTRQFGEWVRLDADSMQVLSMDGKLSIPALYASEKGAKYPDYTYVTHAANLRLEQDDETQLHTVTLGAPILKFLVKQAKRNTARGESVTLYLGIKQGQIVCDTAIPFSTGSEPHGTSGVVMPIKQTEHAAQQLFPNAYKRTTDRPEANIEAIA